MSKSKIRGNTIYFPQQNSTVMTDWIQWIDWERSDLIVKTNDSLGIDWVTGHVIHLKDSTLKITGDRDKKILESYYPKP